MMKKFLPISLLFFTGCCHQKAVQPDICQKIVERTGFPVEWRRESNPTSYAVKELTRSRALEIAFLQNPRIQELCEEIGIPTAELYQAGLWKNPLVDFAYRFPVSPP